MTSGEEYGLVVTVAEDAVPLEFHSLSCACRSCLAEDAHAYQMSLE